MAWLTEVPEEAATGPLKTLYEAARASFGMVPNFFKAQGVTPDVAGAQGPLFEAALRNGALSAGIKEQLAVVVSGLNTSSYCVALHMENLRHLNIDRAVGRKLAVDYPNAPVPDNVRALFRFADRLTRKPADVERADWDAAAAAGWSEAQLLEAVQVVALMNFANRISIGLGLVADF